MALARYFSKDLLAINRLINTSPALLTDQLNGIVVTIAFDENASSFEGTCGLDMLVRLVSRLYPRIKILDLSGKCRDKVDALIALAKSINSDIEIVSNEYPEDFYVLAGSSSTKVPTNTTVLYFGSDNWLAKYSLQKHQTFGLSQNPIGAAMSACIAVSNIFRLIFRRFLPHQPPDNEVTISVFSLDFQVDENPEVNEVFLDDLVLAGVGAIGNGTIWTLSRLPNLTGKIHLVDDQEISWSNLQRYILFDESNVGAKKVQIARGAFSQTSLSLEVTEGRWDDFVFRRGDSFINCVGVGIDNEKDRIGIQSSLPRTIYNAFTEAESIGITRHTNFGSDACLACSYVPLRRQKDFVTEVAENCNIADKAEYVKICHNLRQAVDAPIPGTNESLLSAIAAANKIPIEELHQFKGMKLDQFYSDFVCGGIILRDAKVNNTFTNVDAPLAFQSAMAGTLLAAEIVKHFMRVKPRKELRSDVYHLSPFEVRYNPFHRIVERDNTGRCVCSDSDFVNRYHEKWTQSDV
jgi:hypothetical protein